MLINKNTHKDIPCFDRVRITTTTINEIVKILKYSIEDDGFRKPFETTGILGDKTKVSIDYAPSESPATDSPLNVLIPDSIKVKFMDKVFRLSHEGWLFYGINDYFFEKPHLGDRKQLIVPLNWFRYFEYNIHTPKSNHIFKKG